MAVLGIFLHYRHKKITKDPGQKAIERMGNAQYLGEEIRAEMNYPDAGAYPKYFPNIWSPLQRPISLVLISKQRAQEVQD